MVVLSAHFAVLACLCAALPLALPPPVEAAHFHGSHSMEKHASSSHSHSHSHSQHGTRSALPTASHTHDGQHQGHKAPDQRSPGLPPLLRRHRAHDHKKAHDHQSQGPHDHAHPKSPRSVFARSRYRREPGPHSRRSSVYVPGEHGDTYLVSRTLPRKWGHGHTGTDKQSSHAYNRRQIEESDLVLGRIDIMGGSTQRLASLTVDSTPIDWTSGQSSAKAFPLNASTTNQTQFIMMPTDDPSNVAGSLNKHVTLATEVFEASNAEMVMYCATYDPDPGSTSALLMTPCTGATQSAAPVDVASDPCSDENDASLSNPHESQIFSYDPSSGKIEPISATASSSGVDNGSNDSTSCGGERVRRDNGNSTTSGSTKPSSTSTSTAPTTSPSQQARNVTLVYVAGSLEVPVSSSPSSSNTNASIGQAAALTTTITTTVVATVTTSGPSNRTVTPAQAAVSVSTSSAPSQSTATIATPSVPATASRSSSSLLSSVPATATSKAPANADESLEVEIVGITPSTSSTARSPSTSATTTTTTTTTSYSSVSPSLDALAVASSIANAMVHPRRPAFVSAAGNVNPP